MPLLPSCAHLSPDDQALVEAAASYAQSELLPLDRACDRTEESIVSILPTLCEMGFMNLLVPAELGGLGCCYRTYASILHEISQWSPSTSVTVSVHNMVASILHRWAKPEPRKAWLSHWGTPENLGAFSVSEAGTGSDASSVKTTARPRSDGFTLDGEKMWVTNGMKAAWFVTLARVKDGADDGKLCAVVVDGKAKGLSRTKITGKMGIRGSETAVISLSDVHVPQAHVLGEVGQGWEVCLSGLIGGRIGIASQATGIAEACLDEMVSYARTREQFGQPIGRFQAIAEMIAQSAMELEAARLLVWRAADAIDAGNLHRTASSMAKLYATETANRIAYRAVQVHGGTGYVNECRAEQLYRDARITTIYEGTSEIQRVVIGRELAKRAATGDFRLESFGE